ncbi:MAG: BON domain-containing protein [Nitrosomonas sp.]|nr:BON domain-containing protein [Nitrosomonas sp.]
MLSRYTLFILSILFTSILLLSGCENYAERTHESWIEAPSGATFDDSTIYARISYGINTDPDLQGSDVDIKVDEGKVSLTGTVTNQNQITKLNMLTWVVDGVKEVDMQVQIR